MNVEQTAIADSLELVVRDRFGRVKSARYIEHGWEFFPNARFLSALNRGKHPIKVPFLYGAWKPLRQGSVTHDR